MQEAVFQCAVGPDDDMLEVTIEDNADTVALAMPGDDTIILNREDAQRLVDLLTSWLQQ